MNLMVLNRNLRHRRRYSWRRYWELVLGPDEMPHPDDAPGFREFPAGEFNPNFIY